MEHTKGKLIRKDFWLDLDENRNPPISIGAVCRVEISEKEAIANAEHIVTCWNSHDDLLAACELGLKIAQMINHPDEHHIQAAIAKAKETPDQALAQKEKD